MAPKGGALGEGGKDRVTMLPDLVFDDLELQMVKTRELHTFDRLAGHGLVVCRLRSIRSIPMPVANGVGSMFSPRKLAVLIHALVLNGAIMSVDSPCSEPSNVR
jgi:hypothetical protein